MRCAPRVERVVPAARIAAVPPRVANTAPVGVQRDEALRLLGSHKVEKLPLVDAAGRLRGLITVKDFAKSEKFPSATKDAEGRLVVGAAVGVGEDAKARSAEHRISAKVRGEEAAHNVRESVTNAAQNMKHAIKEQADKVKRPPAA